MCAGEVVEVGSGAEVSCLPASSGADTYLLHKTTHIAAGGGKLYELGTRVLELEAGVPQGDVVNLLVRFRVMDIVKVLLSTQYVSWCGWETVFSADCGDAHLVRKASGTRNTHVRNRCAWYLRSQAQASQRVAVQRR